MNTLSFLYLTVYAVTGLLIGNAVFKRERPLVRLWLGLVIGLALLLWLPALFAFLFSFGLLSQLLALLCCILASTILLCTGQRFQGLFLIAKNELLPFLATVLPLFLLSVYLLSTHTIAPKDGALYVGQSTYGDLAMHLGFITSIGEQGTFPPMYSICPDTPVGYPFLCDSISSTFYVLGVSLRFAAILPAAYALLLVFSGVYLFFSGWLKQTRFTVFATLLFFVGGGFGFAYFFDVAQFEPGKFQSMLTAFYETPTNFVGNGLRWVNPIADMLIPQRATLFGWALLFPCLYLLYRAGFEEERALFLPLGILSGTLPLVHTHSFLALGILSAYLLFRSFFLAEGKRQYLGYLSYALFALLLAAPQLLLFTFRQSGGFLHFNWNWDNYSDSFLWFYIKNLGLLFLLLPAALLGAEREDRHFFGGAAAIWILAECVQFQPNAYDNNKLLFVVFAFACGLVGKWLCRTREQLLSQNARAQHTKQEDAIAPEQNKWMQRASIHFLSLITVLALFLSGVMTLMREVKSEYQLISADQVQMAAFVKENTAPDAVFLTNNNHNNAIAVLTGRNIVCGSGSYLFYHGVDYAERENALRQMYEEPALYLDALSERYNIDYVLIGDYEKYAYACDTAYFASMYPKFYESDTCVIYSIRENDGSIKN